MDNKESFENWLKLKHKNNSGAPSSYLRCIELLSDSFYKNAKINKKSLYEIKDIELLNSLLKEVLEIQKNENSYLFRKEAPGYGDNNFYSASLSNYIKFIKDTTKHNIIATLKDSTNKSGLNFSNKLINRFIASLCTKPFVICSGLSGSGKTKLAQAFAQWICENENQYKIIPVGADWTNSEPLLGYSNALNKEEYVSPENGVLDLMIRAKLNIENDLEVTKPYFLILDEMNLSHVERYFADFLSTMESGDSIPLHNIKSKTGEDSIYVPQSISLPKNLFIIGTVNIDETTYMFSPKVLDRANVIEFRITETEMQNYLKEAKEINMDMLLDKGIKGNPGAGYTMAADFLKIALEKHPTINNSTILVELFKELQKAGAEFGYRSASEINELIGVLELLTEGQNDWDGITINKENDFIDIAIMQKLLPKLHGSRNKLSKVLPVLGGFCLADNSKIKENYLDKFVSNSLTDLELKADTNIKYKISFEKICRMYKNAVENGFASYAEALLL